MSVIIAAPVEQYPAHLAVTTTPTCSDAAAGYPASRLVNYDPTLTLKVNGSGPDIIWDLGVAREFDVIALIHTTTTNQATWTIDVSDNGTTWNQIKANGMFWAHLSASPGAGPWTEALHPNKNALERNLGYYRHFQMLTRRYIKIHIADSIANTNLTFGRLFLGKAFVPTTGAQYGSSFSFTDAGRRERTDKGALVLESAKSITSINLKMDFLSKQEMFDFVWDFNYWRGGTREMLVCLDDTDIPRMQKNTIYCTISEGRQINFDHFNLHSQSWILESIA